MMVDLSYRTMQLDDYEGLLALWRSCSGLSMRDADSLAGTRKYLLRNPGLSFVAEQQGDIVGSLMAGHDGRRGYIQHLAVMPALREQGIASRLVELCLGALGKEGIVKSHVHVMGHNGPGRQFWTHRGWIHRDEIEMYSFINGADANA